MAMISGLFRVALSLPLLLLGACTSIPPSSSANTLNASSINSPVNSPINSPVNSLSGSPNPAPYQPPLREIPLRTESAGVRLNEEYCIDRTSSPAPAAQTRLAESLPRLVLSVQTLLPLPIVPPKMNQNLSCRG